MPVEGFLAWLQHHGTSERALAAYRHGAELILAAAGTAPVAVSHVTAVVNEQKYTGAPEQRLDNLRRIGELLMRFQSAHPDGRFDPPVQPPDGAGAAVAEPDMRSPFHDPPPNETPASVTQGATAHGIASRSATDLMKCVRCGRMQAVRPGDSCPACGTKFPVIRTITKYEEPTDHVSRLSRALPAASVFTAFAVFGSVFLLTFVIPFLFDEIDEKRFGTIFWTLRGTSLIVMAIAAAVYWIHRDD